MKKNSGPLVAAMGCLLFVLPSCAVKSAGSVTVPIVLDHNRMLVDAEFQRNDGEWRTTRLWVDTGNPDFFMNEALARDLGIDLSEAEEKTENGRFEVAPPTGVRIGGLPIRLEGVKSYVVYQPPWLFSTMHNDANLPSTVLKQYQVVFDYPELRLIIAEPGNLEPQGVRAPASVHPATGIVQIDAVIDGDSLSFALDNGASYTFTSEEVLARVSRRHPSWPRTIGAVGCANIWGWWPEEPKWLVMRLPEMQWGSITLSEVGFVGLPEAFPLATWYSQKTAHPVDGLLGPNAFKAFRVMIDYADSAVYFEKRAEFDSYDMDLVGLTLRPEADGSYQVIGVIERHGKPVVADIEPGDELLRVDDIIVRGATMGTVVDALRGTPGDIHVLELQRNGERFTVEARVERIL